MGEQASKYKPRSSSRASKYNNIIHMIVVVGPSTSKAYIAFTFVMDSQSPNISISFLFTNQLSETFNYVTVI